MGSVSNFTGGGNNHGGNNNGGSNGGGGLPPISLPSASQHDVSDLLVDYNERFKNADPAKFRDDVIDQTLTVLISKNKPNPLLTGAAGVGKTRVVEDIARMLANDDHRIPKTLKDHVVYELPLANMVAGCGVVGQLEQRATDIINFAQDPDNKAILFIDEIHVLMEDPSGQTYDKVAQIMKPALARGDIKVIGSTTLQEAHALEDDPAFNRRFARVLVDELTRDQTLEVLRAARPSYQAHHRNKVTVSDDVLRAVTVLADEYTGVGSHRPDNALTLLDRAMATVVVDYTSKLGEAVAKGNQQVIQALQQITVLPLTEHKARAAAKAMMTGTAHPAAVDAVQLLAELDRIKGQANVLDEVVSVLERDKLGIFPRSRPLAFMFAGPSGVGKSESTKILSRAMTGEDPVRINMAELSNQWALTKILGSPRGYIGSDSKDEKPLDCLQANPYRVVLLDEFDKGCREAQRLFMDALDEGYIKDNQGKLIDFSKAVVIATTNAGRDDFTKRLAGFGNDTGFATLDHQQVIKALEKSFEPEVIARFTKVTAFNSLDIDVYREVLVDGYARQRERILADFPHLTLPTDIPSDELDMMVAQTYVPSQGARPANVAVRRWIEEHVLAARKGGASTAGTGVGAVNISNDDDSSED